MTIDGRILPHRVAAGAANMALDEALLEDVAAGRRFAYVRTYEWAAPTLSLGYFQRMADAEADPRFRSAPIVRRATGGGALWHDREITYAVIVPAAHPFARQAQAFYRVVHEAVRQVIATRGLEVARRGGRAPSQDAAPGRRATPDANRPFLCFADRDAEDLVSNDVKIVGSAQRRRAGAVLQHGSILLTRSGVTPELLGVGDLVTDTNIEAPDAWSNPITQAIARSLELSAQASEIPERVLDRALDLETSIYANPGWTRRR